MGYFATLYLADLESDGDGVRMTTSVYEADVGDRVFFSWIPGERPPGMFPYGRGTLFSDARLEPRRGYPRVERLPPGRFLFDVEFHPGRPDAPVLFHALLPEGYVPFRNEEPFIQPSLPAVNAIANRVVATWATERGGRVRFWAGQRGAHDRLEDYDLERLFSPGPQRAGDETTAELNLGVLKLARTWK